MNATVQEWVSKAEGDYNTTRREQQVTENPNFDAICFHAQQCIEKLMKAVLIDRGLLPPKTHDLLLLDQLLRQAITAWSASKDDLRFLTRAAVDFRYPGEAADREEAQQAYEIAARLRGELLRLL